MKLFQQVVYIYIFAELSFQELNQHTLILFLQDLGGYFVVCCHRINIFKAQEYVDDEVYYVHWVSNLLASLGHTGRRRESWTTH